MAGARIAGITIEIGGDTTKLTKALSDVNKTLKSTGSGLKDVDKLLKLNPGNVTLLKQKQDYLNKSIADTKKKLDTEKEALKQLKANSTTGEVTEQQMALEREIIATQTELDKLTQDYKEFGSVGGQQLQAAGEKIQGVGKSMQSVGKTMTTHVTAPVVAGFTAAIKTTADFDAQMSKVQAITGSTGDDMVVLRDKAREMGAKTKFSATEAGEAMEYMGMAGWKSGDMLDGLEGIMNLAAASGEDLGTTSDIVTDALTAFGLKAKDSGRFADILAAASTNANTNVGMLGESFKYVAPVAGAMGYSAEDVSIALGLMANSGIKASSAGTALRTILTNMAKPTEAMAGAMDDLGVSLDDGNGNMKSFREVMTDLRAGFSKTKIPADELQASYEKLDDQLASGEITQKQWNKANEELMKKAFGAEGALKAEAAATLAGKTGMSGLLAIVNASDEDFDKLTAAIDGSSETMVKTKDGAIIPMSKAIEDGIEWEEEYSGAAEQMASVMQDNLNGQFTILKSQLEELAISFGEIAMPVVRKFVGHLQNLVDWFNKLSPSTKETIAKVAALAAAIGPLLLVGGKVVTGAGTVVKTVGKIKGAIGAAGAAGGLVGRIGGLVTAAGPILAGGAVVAGIVAGGVLIYKNWDKIKAGAKILGNKLKTAWGNIKTNVTAAAKKIGEDVKAKFDVLKTNAVKIFGDLGTNLKSKLNAANTALVTVAGNIGKNIKTKFDELKSAAPVVFENMATSLKSKLNAAKTALETVAGNIGSGIKTKFEELKSAAPVVFEGMATSLKSKLNAAKTALETIAGNIGSAIKTAFETLKTNAETVFGNMGTGLKSKLNAAKTSLETVAGNIGSGIKTKFEELSTNAKAIFEDLGKSIGTKFDEIKKNVTTTITNLASDAKTKFDEITTNAVNAAKQLGTDVENAFNAAKKGIATAAGNIATGAKEKFDGMKKNVGDAVSSLGTKIKTAWGDIRDNVDKKINGLTSNASTKFDTADKAVSGSVGNISTAVKDNLGPSAEMATSCFVTVGKAAKTDAGGGIKYAGEKVDGLQKKLNKSSSTHFNSQMTSAGSAAKNDLGAGANTAKADVGGMQNTLNKMSLYTFGKTVDTAASKAGTLASKMSSSESSASSLKSTLANMKLKMPSFSLPKFSLDWGTTTVFGKTFNFPKGINVSWHRDAYDNPLMFTSPTVLQTPHGLHGFGDGPGGEIVLSDKKLREIAGGGATYNINVYGADGQNVNDLAYAIQRRLVALERQREAAGIA